jgi:hypothetical protein
MEHKIPQAVIDAAHDLISLYGNNVRYIGIYKGKEAYSYYFPENADTGFPFVYLYDGIHVKEINGFESLDILSTFFKY